VGGEGDLLLMVGRRKMEKYDFDPTDPQKRLEVGDVFITVDTGPKKSNGRVSVLVGKKYMPDMSVLYEFENVGYRRHTKTERSMLSAGGGGMARIHKSSRHVKTVERAFEGTPLINELEKRWNSKRSN
jgi:hypothetical protein